MSAVRELRDLFRLRILQMAAVGALFAFVIWRSFSLKLPVRDLDNWWHLKVGEWILQNHAFPHNGIFSGTLNPGVGDRMNAYLYFWFYLDRFDFIPTHLLLQRGASSTDGHSPIRIVGGVVAGEGTGVRTLVVGDGNPSVGSHHVGIETDQTQHGSIRTAVANAVCRVAGRTTEAGTDMLRVLGEAGVLHDVREIVTLPTESIRTVRAQVRTPEQVGDHLARRHRLAQLIAALEDVGPLRSMGTAGPGAAEFAVIVAVVAIGTVDLRAHGAPLRGAIQDQHVGKQARLRQGTGPRMKYRVAGSGAGNWCSGRAGDLPLGNAQRSTGAYEKGFPLKTRDFLASFRNVADRTYRPGSLLVQGCRVTSTLPHGIRTPACIYRNTIYARLPVFIPTATESDWGHGAEDAPPGSLPLTPLGAVPRQQGVADVAFIGEQLHALIAGSGFSHGHLNDRNSIITVNHNGSWR